MIIGSGMSYHNMRGFNEMSSKPKNAAFDKWLRETLMDKPLAKSVIDLMYWVAAPSALHCHPREEHLLPLHVCLGSNMALLKYTVAI